jgi:diguanylate cyclase (GGDEF)-like protein/PAS domain S-box-containing protein
VTLAHEDAGPSAAEPVVVRARDGWLAAVAEAQQLVRDAAHAGPNADPGPLLERLVHSVSAIVDAPVAVAVPHDGRLVWWTASSDADVARGLPVDVDGTACGEAWRTGTVQHVPGAMAEPEPDAAELTGALTLRNLARNGTDDAVLVVPLVHGADVVGILSLTAPAPGWFDRNDERAALLLARTAAAALSRYHPGLARAATPPDEDGALPRRAGLPRRGPRVHRAPPQPARAPEPGLATPAPARAGAAEGDPSVPDPLGTGLWEWDAINDRCRWSPAVGRLVGVAPGTAPTMSGLREVVHPADRRRFDAAVQAITAGRGAGGALRLLSRDGARTRRVFTWSEPLRDTSGGLLGAWGAVVDLTALDGDGVSTSALRTSRAALRAAQELTGAAVWEWHPETNRLVWSPEMFRLLGLSPDELVPTLDRWHALVHPEDVDRVRRLDVAAREGSGTVETYRVVRPEGEVRYLQSWSTATPAVHGQGGRVVHGATVDVTRQVRDRVMLERLSTTDALTGLANRLGFDRRMHELLEHPGFGDITLMLLDLDRFKLVNDSLGHEVGDRLLVEVARRLVAAVPRGSTTARMGGDEFVVIPPVGTSVVEVRKLAEGMIAQLRAPYVLPGSGEMLVCPASIGIAGTEGRPMGVTDLLREADIALYRAKDSGRDRFVLFDDGLRARVLGRQHAERRLREALEQDLLVLEYQPIVDFVGGRIVGAEALIRMRDLEEGRLLGPDMFIDVAEDTGLVVEVDSWVIEAAIRQVVAWGDRIGKDGVPPWVAINVSPRSMEHPRVVRRLVDAVKDGEVPKDRIKVELTEHSFLGALPGSEASLLSLMAAGVPVGIDDFGTGYSAMAYLQRYDLDFMKIDRSFVANVGQAERADAVVTAIVDLAHAHGMRVTAEGVETTRQARRLREIGCDYAQGFHFGRPGPPGRIVRT